MPSRTWKKILAASAFALLTAAGPVMAAEEAELDLFSVTQTRGGVIRTGEKTLQFVGASQGSVYAQTDEGPLRAGSVVCTATLEIDTESRAQKGSGACTFASEDGGEVYGKWTCAGFFLIGCSGPFELAGGSGRLKGVTGAGEITFRGAVSELVSGKAGMAGVVEFETLVFWRNLKLKLP